MHSRRHVTRNSYTPVTRRHARGSRSTFISHMNDASTKFGSLSDARRGDCLWERQPSPRTKVTLRLTCWACWSCTRHHLLSCIRFMTLRIGSSWWREVTANSSSRFHGVQTSRLERVGERRAIDHFPWRLMLFL